MPSLALPRRQRKALFTLFAVGFAASTLTATSSDQAQARAAAVTTFANTGAITINDNAAATPYPSAIAVSGLSGSVTKVTVTLDGFTHNWMNDVEMALVGPTGNQVGLMMRAGTSGNKQFTGANLTFDDGGIVIPNVSGQNLTGTHNFVPTVNGTTFTMSGTFLTSLASFNGLNPNGDWKLYIRDWDAIKSGSVSRGWSISFTGPSAATAPTVAALPDIIRGSDAGECFATIAAPAPTMTGSPVPTLTFAPVWPTNNRFPVSTTAVAELATAANGTLPDATSAFTVTVADNENPVMAFPSGLTSPLTVVPTGATGAVVTYSAFTATDNCGTPTISRTAGLASGSTFPIGDTVVTHRATDGSNNQRSISFTVSVTALPATSSTTSISTTTSNTTTTMATTTLATTTTVAMTTTTAAPPIPQPPVWVDSSLAGMAYKVPFADGVSATGIPLPTYSLTGTLASGMAFNAILGTIEGIPNGGTYDFTITASNTVGSVTQRFAGTVGVPALVLNLDFGTGASLQSPQMVKFFGSGLIPGTNYRVVQTSTPRLIAAGVVGAGGSFTDTLIIPSDTEAGGHQLTLTAFDVEGVELTAKAWFSVDAKGTILATSMAGPVEGPEPAPTIVATTVAPTTATEVAPSTESVSLVSESDLAFTGRSSWTLTMIAIGMALIGILLMITSRRRVQ
jgi:HYR domain